MIDLEELTGVHTYLITPFTPNNVTELNEDEQRKNVKYLRKHGIQVLVSCAQTGECYSLTPEENKRVIEIVAEEKGNAILVTGVPSGIKTAIEVAKHAEEEGADAILVFPPQGRTSEEGLYDYYKMVADSVEIGLMPFVLGSLSTMLTNNPNFVKRLIEIENVVAFKYESADLWTLGKLMSLSKGKVAWICSLSFPSKVSECYFRLGIVGLTDGISNFAPQLPIRLYRAALEENWEEVKKVEGRLAEIYELRRKAGSVAFVKAALDMIGLAGGSPRPPLLPISDENKKLLEELLKELEYTKVVKLSTH